MSPEGKTANLPNKLTMTPNIKPLNKMKKIRWKHKTKLLSYNDLFLIRTKKTWIIFLFVFLFSILLIFLYYIADSIIIYDNVFYIWFYIFLIYITFLFIQTHYYKYVNITHSYKEWNGVEEKNLFELSVNFDLCWHEFVSSLMFVLIHIPSKHGVNV